MFYTFASENSPMCTQFLEYGPENGQGGNILSILQRVQWKNLHYTQPQLFKARVMILKRLLEMNFRSIAVPFSSHFLRRQNCFFNFISELQTDQRLQTGKMLNITLQNICNLLSLGRSGLFIPTVNLRNDQQGKLIVRSRLCASLTLSRILSQDK